MKLDELYMEPETFWDDEETALEGLPVNKSGLKQLLAYLECYDSPAGWRTLLEEFGDLLGEQTLEEKRLRAAELFGDEWSE